MNEENNNLALDYLVGKSGVAELAQLKVLLIIQQADAEFAEKLKEQLKFIKIDHVECKPELLKHEFKVLKKYDIVVDCSLNMSQSIDLNEACRKQGKKYIKASLYNNFFSTFTDFGYKFESSLKSKNSLLIAPIKSIKKTEDEKGLEVVLDQSINNLLDDEFDVSFKEVRGSMGKILNKKKNFKAVLRKSNVEKKKNKLFVECDLKSVASLDYKAGTGRLFENQSNKILNFKSLKNILSTDFEVTGNLEKKESLKLREFLTLIWNFEKIKQNKLSLMNFKKFKAFVEESSSTLLDDELIENLLFTTQPSFHVIELLISQVSLEILKSVGMFNPLPQISIYGDFLLNLKPLLNKKILIIGSSILAIECKRLLNKISAKEIISYESVKKVELRKWSEVDVFIYCFESETDVERINNMSIFYEKPAFCFYIDQNKGFVTCAIPNKTTTLKLSAVIEYENSYSLGSIRNFPSCAKECADYARDFISNYGMTDKQTLIDFLKDPKSFLKKCKKRAKSYVAVLQTLREALTFNIDEEKDIVKCIEAAYHQFFYHFRDRLLTLLNYFSDKPNFWNESTHLRKPEPIHKFNIKNKYHLDFVRLFATLLGRLHCVLEKHEVLSEEEVINTIQKLEVPKVKLIGLDKHVKENDNENNDNQSEIKNEIVELEAILPFVNELNFNIFEDTLLEYGLIEMMANLRAITHNLETMSQSKCLKLLELLNPVPRCAITSLAAFGLNTVYKQIISNDNVSPPLSLPKIYTLQYPKKKIIIKSCELPEIKTLNDSKDDIVTLSTKVNVSNFSEWDKMIIKGSVDWTVGQLIREIKKLIKQKFAKDVEIEMLVGCDRHILYSTYPRNSAVDKRKFKVSEVIQKYDMNIILSDCFELSACLVDSRNEDLQYDIPRLYFSYS